MRFNLATLVLTMRTATAGLLALASLAGSVFVINAIGVPPWLSVPAALTVAVVIGFLLGARADL